MNTCRLFAKAIPFAVLVLAGFAPPARSADLIAFTSGLSVTNFLGGLVGGEERGGIFVMRPDGTGLKQLTSFQTLNFRYQPDVFDLPDDHPTVSPDGRFILFTSSREDEGGILSGLGATDNFEVFRMRVNGSDLRRLTFNPLFDGEAVFSPDGTKIVFVSQAAGLPAGQELDFPNIFVMDVDGNVLQRVTASGFSDIEPAWSPDGKRIVYTRVTDEGTVIFGDEQKQIRIADADGTNKNDHVLFDAPGQDHDASFHPNGASVVISSELAGRFPYGDVVRISVPTTGQGNVLANLTADDSFLGVGGGGDPVFSTDGTKIAYMKAEAGVVRGPQKLHVMNANGTGKVKLDAGIPGLLNIHPGFGRIVDTDADGTPDYLEPANLSLPLTLLPGFGLVDENFDPIDYAGSRFGAALALADLNHDFRLDLVAGLPGQKLSGLAGAGSVAVLFGSSTGPRLFENPADASGSAALARIASARPAAVANGNFGASMASGDFNHDGFRDVAIGAPGSNAVFVHLGGAVSQTLGGSGAFGSALAAGDFNRDGFADLAVGAPGEVRSGIAAGAVRVFYGGASGLGSSPQVIDQAILPVATGIGRLESGDRLGAALAAGDISNDATDDLVIGVPGEDIAAVADAGLFHVVAGSSGLPLPLAAAIHRDTRILPAPFNVLQSGAQLGSVAAIGKFRNGNATISNLAVGVPDFDVTPPALPGIVGSGTKPDAGIVAIFDGRSALLGTEPLGPGVVVWTGQTVLPNTLVDQQIQASMRLGQTLAVGQLTGDTIRDLAIAAPGHNVAGVSQAGSVFLVPGSAVNTGLFEPVFSPSGGGLVPASVQRIDQASVGAVRETNDRFGGSLAVRSANTIVTGDIDGDGLEDLFVGSPHESGPYPENGLVSLRYGIGVGTFRLTPANPVVARAGEASLDFEWAHPEVWTDLESIELRVGNDQGSLVWLKFDVAAGTTTLVGGETGPQGHRRRQPDKLRTPFASVDLDEIAFTGSGATGREVSIHVPMRFSPDAPAGSYRIETFATDVHGNSQGYDPVGTLTILPKR